MKRLHVHVSVADLDQSIRFYSTLFATQPTVTKTDYAKWMLDDPRVNFAISTGQHTTKGIEHLGIQVESSDELAEVYARLNSADRPVLEEGATTCCYAKSEKSWIADPQGVVWETFHTTGEAVNYGTGPSPDAVRAGSDAAAEGNCCAPAMPAAKPAPQAATACCG
jgi:catechol 2,3-dioxygenase-like lactoylglutathione lyase family enzyme